MDPKRFTLGYEGLSWVLAKRPSSATTKGSTRVSLKQTYLTGIGCSAGTATAVTLFFGLPSMILSEYTR